MTAQYLHCELIFTVTPWFTVHYGALTYTPPLVLASGLSSACSVACFSILCSDIFVSIGCLSAAHVTIVLAMQKGLHALRGWIQALCIYMDVSLKKQANKEAAEDSTGTFISFLQKKTKDVWINLMDGFGRTTDFFFLWNGSVWAKKLRM